MTDLTQRPPSRYWLVGLAFALAAGAVLRLAWVDDMEYKADEAWTFHRTLAADSNDPHPWLGMPTSYEIRHPSGTVYVFTAIARLFGTESPTELATACRIVDTSAIFLIVAFALLCVPMPDKEAWLWGAALVAVNPIAVLMHRKIWPPSIVPPFAALFWIAYWYRGRRLGAFAWGLAGPLFAQIHPGYMFLTAGFAAWTLLLQPKSVRWRWWFLGSLIGVALLVPWLRYSLEAMRASPISQRKIGNAFELKFWLRWLTESFGFSLSYALGDDFDDFLEGPKWRGQPTYAVGILHAVGFAVMIYFAVYVLKGAWEGRRNWLRFLRSEGEPTRFAVLGCLLGFGTAFTATLLPVHRHYMNLTFPLMEVGIALVALRSGLGRRFLVTAFLLQLAISAFFLLYIHALQNPIRGDYGEPFRLQVERGANLR